MKILISLDTFLEVSELERMQPVLWLKLLFLVGFSVCVLIPCGHCSTDKSYPTPSLYHHQMKYHLMTVQLPQTVIQVFFLGKFEFYSPNNKINKVARGAYPWIQVDIGQTIRAKQIYRTPQADTELP